MKSPLRSVMVPLDGSPLSRQALGIGAGIARREGAVLHLVTVIAPIATVPTEAGSFVHDSTVEAALHDGFRRYLEEQAEAVRRLEPGVAVTCSVIDGGITGALARYARDEDIDLIAMTTHGWGGLKRLWLGSIAERLLHHVPCPTLLWRPTTDASFLGLHRVLVAVACAADADVLLEPALALGTLVEGARYTLLQVVQLEPPPLLRVAGIPQGTVRDWVAQVAREAAVRLERIASGLRHRGIAADARVLVERRAGEQILGFARRSGADLIVVGTSADGLERTLFGSVADTVVRGATQMVLAVPVRVGSTGAAAGYGEVSEPAPAAALG